MRVFLPGAMLCLALSSCTPGQVQSIVATSQLYCGVATSTGPLVVAIVDTSGRPVSVLGKTAQAVAAICAAVDAIPISPPASAASAPVVAVDTAAVRVGLMRR
jgi:hypothetical protein